METIVRDNRAARKPLAVYDRRTVVAALGTAATAGLTACLGNPDASRECDALPTETVTSLPSPTLGDADAPVTVETWEDFACPSCRSFALEVMPRLREEHVVTGQIQLVHRDLPLPVDDEWSWVVPSAARAVQDARGDEAFFKYATLAYEDQGDYSYESLVSSGEAVGADPCAVRSAASRGRYRAVITADRAAGIEAGIESVPTVVVDGDRVDPTWAAIDAAVSTPI